MIENADALIEQMNADRARRELRSAKATAFVSGVLVGALAVGAAVAVLIVPKTKALAATVDQISENTRQITAQRDALQQQVTDLSQQLGKAKIDLTAAEMPEAATPLYKLLYDPAPAGSSNSSAAQLLDLVRPGLGTTLAKLQDASRQGPAGNPRWLIPGYARPIVNGNAQGFYYQWTNLQSGEVETFTPKGTILSGTN